MKLDKKEWIIIAILAIMLLYSISIYPTLGEKIPIHWNAAGEVDGWGAPWTIFLLPVVSLLVYVMFLAIPFIAVHKKNVNDFYKRFGFGFRLIFTAFMALIFWGTVMHIHGNVFNMSQLVLPGISALLLYIGYVLQFTKRNFFIGIRTPWTLSSDKVWKKTHEVGGKLMMLGAVVFFITAFLPKEYFIYGIGIFLVLILATIPYSYYLFRQEKKHGRS